MNKLLAIFTALLAAVSVPAATNISAYPNKATPSSNDLFILATAGVTNWNVSFGQISNLVVKTFGETNPHTLYVSPTGNDSLAQRGRPNLPWLTISNAVRQLANGDTLYILPGRYTNSVASSNTVQLYVSNCTFLLRRLTNVTIQGVRGSSVIVVTNDGIGGLFGIHACNGITLDGLTIQGQNGKIYQTNSVELGLPVAHGLVQYADVENLTCRRLDLGPYNDFGVMEHSTSITHVSTNNILLDDCYGYALGSYIFFDTYGSARGDGALWAGSTATIRNCRLKDCYRGIELFHLFPGTTNVSGWTVINNVIENCIELPIGPGGSMSGVFDAQIVGNRVTWRNNAYFGSNDFNAGYAAIEVGQGLTDAVVANNYIANYTNAISSVNAATNVICYGNVISNSATPYFGYLFSHDFAPIKWNLGVREIQWPETGTVLAGTYPGLGTTNYVLYTSATNMALAAGLVFLVVDANGVLSIWNEFGPTPGGGGVLGSIVAANAYLQTITMTNVSQTSDVTPVSHVKIPIAVNGTNYWLYLERQ